MTGRPPTMALALRRLSEAAHARGSMFHVRVDEADPQQIVISVEEGTRRRVVRRLDAASALALAKELYEGRGLLDRVV